MPIIVIEIWLNKNNSDEMELLDLHLYLRFSKVHKCKVYLHAYYLLSTLLCILGPSYSPSQQ
jgi:hypothetical protein